MLREKDRSSTRVAAIAVRSWLELRRERSVELMMTESELVRSIFRVLSHNTEPQRVGGNCESSSVGGFSRSL